MSTSKLTEQVTRENMTDYSIYVAQNRAIASLVDGLKPSQRRSITSADDLHLSHTSRYMKAAKIEGTILGDYHPHGGVSLAGLIQPFSMRYPLMEGQGNWGCPDNPGSVAASRYVEARLSKFCEDVYLSSRAYSDKAPNYDGRLDEVVRYYPPVPGVLLTSPEGIAIGLTTKIPPYEIGSLCRSMLSYYRRSSDSDESYLDIIPDTCEGSVLLSPKSAVDSLHKTGSGTLSYRAKVHYETLNGYLCLVVDAFPPYFSRKKLESSTILSHVESGDLTLSNESSTGIRYVFRSKSEDVLKDVLDVLESNVSYKYIIEHDGVVHQYSLSEIYEDFRASYLSYLVRMYTDLESKSKYELDYYTALFKLKSSPNKVRSLIDMTEFEAIEDLMSFLSTDRKVVSRILSSSIRSLLKDNLSDIQNKISEYSDRISECRRYINSPESKFYSNIEEVMKKYGGAPNCTRGGVTSSMSYIIDQNNDIVRVANDSGAKTDSNYFIVYNDEGYIACTKDIFESRLPDSVLKGIPTGVIGVNSLNTIYVVGESESYPLGEWALRVRRSRIELKGCKLEVRD